MKKNPSDKCSWILKNPNYYYFENYFKNYFHTNYLLAPIGSATV